MLTTLAKLLKALNAEGSPAQISLGFMFGMMIGLTPLWTITNLLLLLIVFLFRINLTAFFLAFATFSGIAYLFDPQMHSLGESLLLNPDLKAMWTQMYINDFWRLTHFNNTLTLGSILVSLILALPLFLISNFIIKKYRQHILNWVRKTKLMKLIKGSKFYRLYEKVSDIDLT